MHTASLCPPVSPSQRTDKDDYSWQDTHYLASQELSWAGEQRGSPSAPSLCCFALGSGGSPRPCSLPQQGYRQHFGQGHALPYHVGLSPIRGIYSCSHIPSNASHSYYENQNHPQAFPKAARVAALSLIENHGSIHR